MIGNVMIRNALTRLRIPIPSLGHNLCRSERRHSEGGVCKKEEMMPKTDRDNFD